MSTQFYALDQDTFPGIGTQALPPPNPRLWRKVSRGEEMEEKKK